MMKYLKYILFVALFSIASPAYAAFSLKDNVTFTFTSSGNSVHMNNVFSGDALILECAVNSSSANRISAVTDSKSNTYTKAGSVAGTSIETELWYALNATVDNGTTVSVTAQTGDLAACVWFDFAGIATSNAFDQKSAGNSGTGGTTANSIDSLSTPTTQNTNDVIFGVMGQANNRAWSNGTGDTNITSTGNGASAGVMAEFKTVAATGAYNMTASLDLSSNWVAQAFAFGDTAISPPVSSTSKFGIVTFFGDW